MPTLQESMRVAAFSNASLRNSTFTTASLDRNDYGRAQEWVIVSSIGTISGAGATLAIQIQDSDDNTAWANITGAASTQNAAGFSEITVRNARRYVRAVCTITGTTPQITVAIIALAGQPIDAPI